MLTRAKHWLAAHPQLALAMAALAVLLHPDNWRWS